VKNERIILMTEASTIAASTPINFLNHAFLAQGIHQVVNMAKTKRNLAAPYGDHRWWLNLHEPEAVHSRVVTYQSRAGDPSILIGRQWESAAHPIITPPE